MELSASQLASIRSVTIPPKHEKTDQRVEDLEDALKRDPKLNVTKRLLDTMFGELKSAKDSHDKPDDQQSGQIPEKARLEDTVTISKEAIELVRRERFAMSVQSGSQKVEMSFEVTERLQITQQNQVQSADPLILDLDGDGLSLTDVRTGSGVSFDLTGDGKKETVSWVRPSDGFLAYDRNGNGTIDNGGELFGDQHGSVNGFAELARFDENRDGAIDSRDSVFENLVVWRDLNQNGTSDCDEVKHVSDYGISSLSLNHTSSDETIAGNKIDAYSSLNCQSKSISMGEAFLNYVA